MMELELGSLWSWTIPLWSLFLIVLFLAGAMSESVIHQGQSGGSTMKRVRFSLRDLK
jgi:hypothetical protein